MRYQHTNTSHNRSSGFSSVAEIAGGMGLRSPQPQQLALDFAPAQVRSHGLRDAHTKGRTWDHLYLNMEWTPELPEKHR